MSAWKYETGVCKMQTKVFFGFGCCSLLFASCLFSAIEAREDGGVTKPRTGATSVVKSDAGIDAGLLASCLPPVEAVNLSVGETKLETLDPANYRYPQQIEIHTVKFLPKDCRRYAERTFICPVNTLIGVINRNDPKKKRETWDIPWILTCRPETYEERSLLDH